MLELIEEQSSQTNDLGTEITPLSPFCEKLKALSQMNAKDAKKWAKKLGVELNELK